jgi:hypothetical protein
MKKLLILICGLSLIGCGRAPHTKALLPYIENFEQTFKASASSVQVKLSQAVPDFADAVCNKGTVLISLDSWLEFSEVRRQALVIHELGHCASNRKEHVEEVFADGCFKSFMSANIDSDDCLSTHWDELVQEMKEHL